MLAQHEVRGAGGLALGAVHSGRVGQLDVLARIAGRESAQLGDASAAQREAAVDADVGDGPGVAVAHPEVAIVAPGRDPIPDPEPLTCVGGDRAAVIDVPGGNQPVADESVQHGCLLARVGHHPHPVVATVAAVEGVGGELGQRLGAFGFAGVDPDVSPAPQRVPDLTDPLTNRLTNSLTRVRAGRGVGGPAHAPADPGDHPDPHRLPKGAPPRLDEPSGRRAYLLRAGTDALGRPDTSSAGLDLRTCGERATLCGRASAVRSGVLYARGSNACLCNRTVMPVHSAALSTLQAAKPDD